MENLSLTPTLSLANPGKNSTRSTKRWWFLYSSISFLLFKVSLYFCPPEEENSPTKQHFSFHLFKNTRALWGFPHPSSALKFVLFWITGKTNASGFKPHQWIHNLLVSNHQLSQEPISLLDETFIFTNKLTPSLILYIKKKSLKILPFLF